MDAQLKYTWADLREDKMINPASGWPIFGPLGPTAGFGSPGNGPGSKNSAGCTNKSAPETNYESHLWALCVFGTDRKNRTRYMNKLRAPQGLHR